MADGMVESADDFKAAGNAAFKAGNFDEAIKQFTSAIELGKKNEHTLAREPWLSSLFALSALTTTARTIDCRPVQIRPTTCSSPTARARTPPSPSSRRR